MSETKIILTEKEMPRAWYNIQADLLTCPVPVESRHQETYQPRRSGADFSPEFD